MFRPRHAYKSPVTCRYRGKAKGCPVFNNLIDINSHMVEQHDECLECLAKLKNRTELYRTLADNNKPSNNVIKSLQRLSSSASNNRLKTCLQFKIIKVNEKSIAAPVQPNGTKDSNITKDNHSDANITKDASTTSLADLNEVRPTEVQTTRHLTKRQKSYHNQNRQLHHQIQTQQIQKHIINHLASPPQDQVSSTQDQVAPLHDDHDCQTSPPMLSTTHIDEPLVVNIDQDQKLSDEDDPSPTFGNKNEGQQTEYISPQPTQPSPPLKYNALSAPATTNTTILSTSPNSTDGHDHYPDMSTIDSDNKAEMTRCEPKIQSPGKRTHLTSTGTTTMMIADTNEIRQSPAAKRRRTQNSLSSDQETSSLASWSLASYCVTSPPSPMSSASSTSSISSSSSYTSSFCSSSSCSSCTRSSPSPSPLSTPDQLYDMNLENPRLKLDEDKIRKIKKRPVLFEDLYYFSDQPSVASTPTTSSGCSPGQHSNTTQNSDQSNGSRGFGLFGCNNIVSHTFQAPPAFVNSLRPCKLPLKSQDPPTTSAPTVAPKVEMINCAICGIKDKPPNISKVYGQNSCMHCTKFFANFLKRPLQLYCPQDGDCLMTFDSRCQACWIKICLQKFDIDEEHRKVGHKYTPKLLSSPNVSLITIDTSIAS